MCDNTDVAMQDMEMVSQATQLVDLVLATYMKLQRILVVHMFV
jgi:hypothetical protein